MCAKIERIFPAPSWCGCCCCCCCYSCGIHLRRSFAGFPHWTHFVCKWFMPESVLAEESGPKTGLESASAGSFRFSPNHPNLSPPLNFSTHRNRKWADIVGKSFPPTTREVAYNFSIAQRGVSVGEWVGDGAFLNIYLTSYYPHAVVDRQRTTTRACINI